MEARSARADAKTTLPCPFSHGRDTKRPRGREDHRRGRLALKTHGEVAARTRKPQGCAVRHARHLESSRADARPPRPSRNSLSGRRRMIRGFRKADGHALHPAPRDIGVGILSGMRAAPPANSAPPFRSGSAAARKGDVPRGRRRMGKAVHRQAGFAVRHNNDPAAMAGNLRLSGTAAECFIAAIMRKMTVHADKKGELRRPRTHGDSAAIHPNQDAKPSYSPAPVGLNRPREIHHARCRCVFHTMGTVEAKDVCRRDAPREIQPQSEPICGKPSRAPGGRSTAKRGPVAKRPGAIGNEPRTPRSRTREPPTTDIILELPRGRAEEDGGTRRLKRATARHTESLKQDEPLPPASWVSPASRVRRSHGGWAAGPRREDPPHVGKALQ